MSKSSSCRGLRIGLFAFLGAGVVTTTLLLSPSGGLATAAADHHKRCDKDHDKDVARFQLHVNPKFAACLTGSPDTLPTAHVKVVKGRLNDRLFLEVEGLKPGLAFDLFTVEHSSLLANGSPDPTFTNFGLAWYQSDLEADENGEAEVEIQTILLNQIFGFDPAVGLPPTNTFHVGFWFNDPEDAVPCGFDATKPTPFNGEHRAGPLAMISVPNGQTGLGPLCTNPNTSTTPATCNP